MGYKLYNRKTDHTFLYDKEKNEFEHDIEQLRVGDQVRLVLESPNDSSSWEKIYFDIVKVDYYKKGGINRPRKFLGRSLDDFRDIAFNGSGLYAYVQPGEIIYFQRKNIYAYTFNKFDHISTDVKPQHNKETIMTSCKAITRERAKIREETDRKHFMKLKEIKRLKLKVCHSN